VTVRALLDQVKALSGLGGVDLAREARRLSDVALAELAAAGDAGVWEATRSASYADVADDLGVTVWAVGKAVRQHNARQKALAERTESDRPKRKSRTRRA
jgi:hypothetical protein